MTLIKNQNGFISKSSATTSAVDYIEDLLARVDEGYTTLSMCIDYSNALDTVKHGMLLTKLDNIGFRGVCNKLLESLLPDSPQFAALNWLL